MRSLGIGDEGEQVRSIQLALEMVGYDPGPLDGVFGPMTERAVRSFQTREMVTGRVDALTCTRLSEVLREHEERQHHMPVEIPHGVDDIRRVFGTFPYTSLDSGFVEVPSGWVKENLVKAVLPIVGKRWVHVKLASVFDHVLGELRSLGLEDEIHQFDIWCARHKGFDPKRGLSTHAWGIACDINWDDNPMGIAGKMNPGIVDVFEKHGFQWGGRWRYRDDMHFQYCRGY